MSLQRSTPALPKYRAMLLSPWLIVGSALILGLAIAFWAVKNTRQERENMARNLLERAGALMWAMEGGARAGMGMQRTASYLQFMMEEVGRQPGIVYLAVITPQGDIVAHSDPSLIGKRLSPGDCMGGLVPSPRIQWRFFQMEHGSRIFEAYRFFSPFPEFSPGMGHGKARHGHMLGMMHGQPKAPLPFPPAERDSSAHGRGGEPIPGGPEAIAPPPGGGLVVVVGLDMASFESALLAGERNTLFTALLVGLLGIGGFISLLLAQSYKLSRRLLLDTRAFADEVIGSLPLGLIILDAAGNIAQVNAVAEKMLDCEKKALLGKSATYLPGVYWAELEQRAGAGQPVLEEEYSLALSCDSPKRDETVPVSISASAIVNEESEKLGTLYLLRDLREVKRLQAELRRNERLSTLGNMAARVAHEIRNPLSSIKGFATYLGSRSENDSDREAASTMIGEVDRLNRVVSELLDFARPSNLTIAPAPLGDLVERAVRLVGMDAETHGVNLSIVGSDKASANLPVAVDAERITQALLNLLLNAVQATNRGGTVSVAILPREQGAGVVRISDTGNGMTPEVLSQVFSPYFTTRAKGTGLGLSIVAKIIEDHQGEIHMTSSPGKGTAVTLRLPLADEPDAGCE